MSSFTLIPMIPMLKRVSSALGPGRRNSPARRASLLPPLYLGDARLLMH
ncbi:MAG: hypothetical protein QXQ60_06895 [Thermofilum sp.]